MRWAFWRKPTLEKRASGSGFTAELMAARESYISGRRGLGELTATVQACVGMWEGAFALAEVEGTDVLTPRILALIGRSLGLRGEAVFYIGDRGLIPASDWDLRTRDGEPVAYRLGLSEAGGGRNVTALAGEVLHVRAGSDPAAPWIGTAPLWRASLTAELLHAVEDALRETFGNAALGTQVVPFPESPETDLDKLGRSLRGERGKIVLRESVNVAAAGGPAPAQDWRPSDLSPDLSKSMTTETLAAAREAICAAFGVLPGLFNPAATGPAVREAERHVAVWALSPLAVLVAEEATAKLGGAVRLDVVRPLQAWDVGGRARALQGIVGALADAKERGLDPATIAKALRVVGLEDT